jgi:hypothetical protein
MLQIIYPVVSVLEDARTYSYRQKVPIRRECPVVAPPFALSEADTWNCNLCGADMPFYIPYLVGDILPLQTNFVDNYNSDRENPAYGFKSGLSMDWYVMVELQDKDGVTVANNIETFCDTYYVGYSQQYGSVQTWFVNTGLLPVSLKCWRLKITYYYYDTVSASKQVERVLYSEYYRLFEECTETTVIESVYDGKDCYGNIYDAIPTTLGANVLPYYNFIRIEGEIELIGTDENVETQTDFGKVLRRTIIENYRIQSGIVAPYFARMLDRVVRGSVVTINGTQYKNFSFSKNNEASRMWVVSLDFTKECTLDNRGCNL